MKRITLLLCLTLLTSNLLMGCGLNFQLSPNTTELMRATFYEASTWQIIGTSKARQELIEERSARMIAQIEAGQLATLAMVQAAVEDHIAEMNLPPPQMLTYKRLVGAVAADLSVQASDMPELQKIQEIILPRLRYVHGAAVEIAPLL